MRILTVRQPWAWAIIHGGKDVENRVRNLAGDYRGPVAIHVGRTEAKRGTHTLTLAAAMAAHVPDDLPDLWPWQCDFGAIIGVVELTGAHRAFGDNPGGFNLCGYNDQCSKWAEPSGWHLTFARPRALVEPIPYKGALGLRNLPAELATRILAAVAS